MWCLGNVDVEMQKHPLIPASYPVQSNSWGFVPGSRDVERKGRIREVPRPFLPASFSLIGMASYVMVRVEMMRIWWIMIRNRIPKVL